MATDLQTGSEQSMSSLLTGIVSDAQTLFKQQMALFKQEVKEDVRKTGQATVAILCGAITMFLGAFLLCMMAAHLLQYLTHWELWACYGLVGLAITALGGLMAYLGREKFKTFNPLPDESLAALQENLEWKTTPR